MNPIRLLLTVLAGFVFIFASDFLIHALWLAPTYKATAELWRTDPEMQQRFHWMLLAQLLNAAAFTVIWAKGFAGRSLATGGFFGLCMGLAVQAWAIAFFVVTPLPGAIAAKWFFSGLAQAIFLGVIIAAIYRPRPAKV